MSVPSGLSAPPGNLDALTALKPAKDLPLLFHRLSAWSGAWWFASAPAGAPGGGRFDLAPPNGTCYVADSLSGALAEKLLRKPKAIIATQELEQLFHATIQVHQSPRAVDLLQPKLTGLGLNAEIHSTLDYTATRAWAQRLWEAGWRALRYALRGDNSLRERGLALFGAAGLRQRAPTGMRTFVKRLDPSAAAALLERRGVSVRPIPTLAELPLQRPRTASDPA